MNRKISFGTSRSGFEVFDKSGLVDTSWYKNLLGKKAEAFFVEHQLQYLSEHAALDFLITCRNSLEVGGRIRIADPDWNHPSQMYLEHASQFRPQLRNNVSSLVRLLWKAGYTSYPIEFWDDHGVFHSDAMLSYDQFGTVTRSSHNDPRAHDPDLKFSSLVVDGVKFSEECDGLGYDEKIIAIGDSHIRFLAGKDETSGAHQDICRVFKGFSAKFVGYHVGPALAFNLDKYGTKTFALEQIESLIKKNILPIGAQVMFSFGEIDCRYHICRQAEAKGMTVDEIVDLVCKKYGDFLERIEREGYRPMVWAPFATTWSDRWDDPEHPVYGSYQQRDRAIQRFNDVMKDFCRRHSYGFLSLYGNLLDKKGELIRSYFCDTIHLSQAARHLLHKIAPNGEF